MNEQIRKMYRVCFSKFTNFPMEGTQNANHAMYQAQAILVEDFKLKSSNSIGIFTATGAVYEIWVVTERFDGHYWVEIDKTKIR